MPRILMYTRPGCGYCTRARRLLESKGVAWDEIDIWAVPGAREEMVERSGGGTTVPQVFIDSVPVGGSDELHDLDRRGELDRMLATAEEKSELSVKQVVILGSGPAGLTAAIYCARAGLSPVVVEGLAAGGQLMNTTDVENYPGFPDGIQGPEMMEKFKEQAARFGTEFVAGDATRLDLTKRPFKIATDDTELEAQTVIVATGASPRTLGIPGEDEYAGRGVSYCATCDGFFFREKEIVVVGGGDTAMEEALFLTRFGKRVTVVHRRDELRASKIMADRALAHDKIEFLWDSVVEEVIGDGSKVVSMRVRNVKTDAVAEHECSGFFVGIGHEPNTALVKEVLTVDDQDYLVVEGRSSFTNVDGVFAAGDVHDHTYRQAVTAAGAGCKAAIDCERWLEAQETR